MKHQAIVTIDGKTYTTTGPVRILLSNSEFEMAEGKEDVAVQFEFEPNYFRAAKFIDGQRVDESTFHYTEINQ